MMIYWQWLKRRPFHIHRHTNKPSLHKMMACLRLYNRKHQIHANNEENRSRLN